VIYLVVVGSNLVMNTKYILCESHQLVRLTDNKSYRIRNERLEHNSKLQFETVVFDEIEFTCCDWAIFLHSIKDMLLVKQVAVVVND